MGKPKGIQAILKERGLWNYHIERAQQAKKLALKLKCKNCAATNIQKDAEERAARLIQQAEDVGYFLSHEQSVSELLASNQSLS
jgi:cytochrome c-type biogenesis protein CcmH/NrfF